MVFDILFYAHHTRHSAALCNDVKEDPFRLSMQNHNLIATISIHGWDFGSSTDAWSSKVQATLG